MGKRKSVFVGGAILIVLLASFFVYSQITAQTGTEGLTNSEFADMMVLALGIPLPAGADSWDDVSYLRKTQLLDNYKPGSSGWGAADGTVTTEEVAYVFAQVIGLNPGDGPFLGQLQALGLMTGAGATDDFTSDDLVTFVNDLTDIVADPNSGVTTITNLYTLPVSPTT